MGLLTMFDAVTVDNIPTSARYVALYVDGSFNNYDAGRAHCPHADVLTLTVVPANEAEGCDCEVGDLTVAQAEAWVVERLAAGVYRPVVYANSDRWENQGLLAGLAKYGSRIRRWVAAFPGTGANVPAGYDAHQYATNGIDTSVCLSNFFDPPAPAPSAPKGIARLLLECDLADLAWTLTPQKADGEIVWRAEEEYASLEVQLGVGGKLAGKWRKESLPFNAPPLGRP